jgi:hypothetical protein
MSKFLCENDVERRNPPTSPALSMRWHKSQEFLPGRRTAMGKDKALLTPGKRARLKEIRDLMKEVAAEQKEAHEDRDDIRVKELEVESEELRRERKKIEG